VRMEVLGHHLEVGHLHSSFEWSIPVRSCSVTSIQSSSIDVGIRPQ
jgi:hypothetical protein